MLEALYPRLGSVSVEDPNKLLETVTDLEVEVHYNAGAHQREHRSVHLRTGAAEFLAPSDPF